MRCLSLELNRYVRTGHIHSQFYIEYAIKSILKSEYLRSSTTESFSVTFHQNIFLVYPSKLMAT